MLQKQLHFVCILNFATFVRILAFMYEEENKQIQTIYSEDAIQISCFCTE